MPRKPIWPPGDRIFAQVALRSLLSQAQVAARDNIGLCRWGKVRGSSLHSDTSSRFHRFVFALTVIVRWFRVQFFAQRLGLTGCCRGYAVSINAEVQQVLLLLLLLLLLLCCCCCCFCSFYSCCFCLFCSCCCCCIHKICYIYVCIDQIWIA